MTLFAGELAEAHAALRRARPRDPDGIYGLPLYLVLGEPGAGRSALIAAQDLGWGEGGAAPLALAAAKPQNTYWLAEEALFVEPGAAVVGPQRRPRYLKLLIEDLRAARPHRPLEAVVLVVSLAALLDLDATAVAAHASGLRRYLAEVRESLEAEVPAYVVLTRYDALWGTGEVFPWGAAREPLGLVLPEELPNEEGWRNILERLEAIEAALQARCLAQLASEAPPSHRAVAFQHLAEVGRLRGKLGAFFEALAKWTPESASPRIRAVVIGNAIAGTGTKMRAGRAQAISMAKAPVDEAGAVRQGGLPLGGFARSVLLPERVIVRSWRARWNQDRLIRAGRALGLLLGALALLLQIVFLVARRRGG